MRQKVADPEGFGYLGVAVLCAGMARNRRWQWPSNTMVTPVPGRETPAPPQPALTQHKQPAATPNDPLQSETKNTVLPSQPEETGQNRSQRNIA